MPRFSVHLDYLFADRPFLQRIDAAAEAGFKAVECRFPQDVPADQFKAAAERNKLAILGINSPHGDTTQFGYAAVPGGEKKWDATFAEALAYVSAAGGSAVHCLAGKVDHGERAAAEKVFVANLKRAADLAAAKNVKLLIEPINRRDQPDYFLYQVERAADIIAKVGKPNLSLQYDFYHVQIEGGDLIRRMEKNLSIIGHMQCSQVPVRNEPDDGGEINYPFLFEAVDRLGYKGWIGAEYRPRGRTEAGLGWGKAYGLAPAR